MSAISLIPPDNNVGEIITNIKEDILQIKNTPIKDVKNYLRDHKLNENGSNAPQDVLRTIYEDAITCGNIQNTNKDVLVNNFLAGNDND